MGRWPAGARTRQVSVRAELRLFAPAKEKVVRAREKEAREKPLEVGQPALMKLWRVPRYL